MENTINKKQPKPEHYDIFENLQLFINSLEDYASDLNSEMDFDNFLKEEIAPIINETDRLHSTSIFSKLDLAVTLSQSELDNKSLSFKRALGKMDNSSICWLLDHIWTCHGALRVLEYLDKGYSNLNFEAFDGDTYTDSLRRDIRELQGWLNSELHDRIQNYEFEIKKLRGRK